MKADSAPAPLDDCFAAKLIVAEYQTLKEEQRARIGFRDNLLYVTLASMITVVAISLSYESTSALLLMPPAAIVLGWTYLMNDEKISAIGLYLRNVMATNLQIVAPTSTPILQWESTHRSDRRRRFRKRAQLIVDLSVFCAVPTFALLAYWVSSGPYSTLLVGISVMEALGVAMLVFQIASYADLASGG